MAKKDQKKGGGAINGLYRIFLYSDMFGYDPAFKFPAYRSYFGSLCTLCGLFFMVVYIIATINAFVYGDPTMTSRFGSTNELAEGVEQSQLELPPIGVAKVASGTIDVLGDDFPFVVKFYQYLRKDQVASAPEDLKNDVIEILDPEEVALQDEGGRKASGVMSHKKTVQAYVQGTINDPTYQSLHITIDCADANDGVDKCGARSPTSGNMEPNNVFVRDFEYSGLIDHNDQTLWRLYLQDEYDVITKKAKQPFQVVDIPYRRGVITYMDVYYRLVKDYYPSRFFPWGRTEEKASFVGFNYVRGTAVNLPAHARLQMEYKVRAGGEEGINTGYCPPSELANGGCTPTMVLPGRQLISIIVQMDKDFLKRTYSQYALLTMLAHWGAIASFLFITFGITAMQYNKINFILQLGPRDMQKMQKNNFDSHGRLRVKTYEVPQEAEKKHGEPLDQQLMLMGYV